MNIEHRVFCCQWLFSQKAITYKNSRTCTLLLQGQYYVYLNAQYAHLGWHVGLTKSGKAKKGHRTTYPFGQKAIQFTRKPIVTPTPHFDLDLTKHQEDLTFIDEGQQVDVHKGPKQIGNIKYIDK